MELRYGMNVNEKGHLTISGCDTVELAQKYGTPLYVLDEKFVRKNCREIKDAMAKYFPNGKVMYASKALNNLAMLKIVDSEGLGVDAVSGGELYAALKAGINPEKLELHGNSKCEDEIVLAVENQIGCIIADGLDELDLIENVCKKLNKKASVSIRLRPNIDVHAHTAVQTAKMDCKFGFGISDGQALEGAKRIHNSEFMTLCGIHCHIGSQIFEQEPFAVLCGHFVDFAKTLKTELGITVAEFNFGGGFGVRYTAEDQPKPAESFVKVIFDTLDALCTQNGIAVPKVAFELGRFIVGEAGTTLYKDGLQIRIWNF